MSAKTNMNVLIAVLCACFIQFHSIPCYAETGEAAASESRAVATTSDTAAAPGGGEGSGGNGTLMPDLFTGTMSYSIPIETPAGRKGMNPALSLLYRTFNGNGWIGVGWDLDIGAIERSTTFGLDYRGEKFVLRLGGSSIDLVKVNDYEYRAKIESGFSRIKQYGADDSNIYWEVTDKSGTMYVFGQEPASRQDDPADSTKIFKWCLNRVEDIHGNFMTFSYTKPATTSDYGQIYPDLIRYTGNIDGTPTTKYVKFHLDDTRTDSPILYTANFPVKVGSRLKTIEIRANDNMVRAYSLTYVDSANTSRSLLASVQQFGKDATVDTTHGNITNETTASRLPAINFSNQPVTNGFTTDSSNGLSLNPTPSFNYLGDFNGDGKTDILGFEASGFFNNAAVWVNYSTSSSFSSLHHTGLNLNPTPIFNLVGDFNGDGKSDILAIETVGFGNDAAVRMNYATGSGFSSLQYTGLNLNPTPSFNYLGDFNGDGKSDILAIETVGFGNDAAVRMNYSTGSGFSSLQYTGLNLNPTPSFNYLGDFNGDGKTDILAIETVGFGNDAAVRMNYSTDSGFSSLQYTGLNLNPTPSFNYLGDFNGDGKSDILAIETVGFGNDAAVRMNYSTGSGFSSLQYTGLNLNPTPSFNYLGDFNGDGKTDILAIQTVGWGTAQVCINYATGSGFRSESYIISLNPTPSFNPVGDFNGDGKTDVLAIETVGFGTAQVYTNTSTESFDLLRAISNGLGGTTTISYTPSTQYQNTQLPFPIQTVSSVITNDGNGVISTMTYTYSGGFHHKAERDFRGFNYANVIGPMGPNGEQSISETWFHQGNDTAVDANNPNVPTGYMKGKPYRTKTTDAQGRLYSESTTIYAADADNFAPYFNPAIEVNANHCDGGACNKQTKTVYGYDIYGNVLREEQHGDLATNSDDRTITRTYAYNTTDWILSKPIKETISSSITAPIQVSSTEFCYDGAMDCTIPPTRGNLTRIILGLEGGSKPEAWMAYDDYGNLISTRDANGHTSTVDYDSTSTFPTIGTNALGHKTVTQYYGVDGVLADKGLYGQVKNVIDSNKTTATSEYDPFGRKKRISTADGSWTSWEYIDFGNVSSQHIRTDTAIGLSSWSYFDGFGRTIRAKKTGSDGKTIATQTKYNSTGTVSQSSLPYFDGIEMPRWTSFTSDPMGRTVRIDNPDNTSVRSCYHNGVTVTLDALNHRKRSIQNVQGKLVQVEEYYNEHSGACTTDQLTSDIFGITTYAYDVMGNLVRVADAENNQTEIQYDSLGHKVNMRDPDMGYWTYTYDLNGNLKTQTDAKGQTITFDYDVLNRLIRKHYPTGPDVVFTYDVTPDPAIQTYPVGRLSSMTDASGVTKYFYDEMGRPVKTIKNVDGIDYAFDNGFTLGRLTNIKYPDNDQVNYTYDAAGYLSVVSSPSGTNYASYSNYNALGQPRSITYANGVTTTYEYLEVNNRLRNITTVAPATTFINLTYNYYDDGTISKITDGVNTVKTQEFAYDEQKRLRAATSNYGLLVYFYDQLGNFTQKEGVNHTYSTVHPHAVATTTAPNGVTTNYTYDANGNMQTDGTRTFTWNYDNMPQSVTANNITTSFVYDGTNTRVKKITPTGDNIYLGMMYECRAGVCTKYIFAGSTRIAMKTDTDVIYYHQDHLGSTIVLSDINGIANNGYCSGKNVRIAGTTPLYFDTLQEAYNAASNNDVIQTRAIDFSGDLILDRNKTITFDGGYDCNYANRIGNSELFGNINDSSGKITMQYFSLLTTGYAKNADSIQYLPFGGTLSGAKDITVNHKYTSQELDAETGLYNYNARLYNPALGRFISADSIVPNFADPQSLNRYAYVRNNPLMYIDPSGHDYGIFSAIIGGIIGGISAGIQSDWDPKACFVGSFIGSNAGLIGSYVGTAVSSAIGGTAGSIVGGAVGGAAAGATAGAMNAAYYGGDVGDAALKGTMWGAVGGAVNSAINLYIGPSVAGVVVSGAAGGALSVAQGGEFWNGFAWSAGAALAMLTYGEMERVAEASTLSGSGKKEYDSDGKLMKGGARECPTCPEGYGKNLSKQGDKYGRFGPFSFKNDSGFGRFINLVGGPHDFGLEWTYKNGDYFIRPIYGYDTFVDIYSLVTMIPAALHTIYGFSSMNYQPMMYMHQGR